MNDIKPFRIEIEDAALNDLRRRLAETRWPDESPAEGRERGIRLAEVRELAEYWADGFDWRAEEASLNTIPQFTADVNGQRIHFFHARTEQADAPVILLAHGYPSSNVEFPRLIELLTDSRSGQGFHVVAPSLPGYGFSTPLIGTDWAMRRMAGTLVELMNQLDYERYGVHGGDVGAGVVSMIAGLNGAQVTGLHTVTDPWTAANTASFLPGYAQGLNADDSEDKVIIERMSSFTHDGSGYLAIQNTRPQTIGYALADSPAFLLAWIVEKLQDWTKVPIDRDWMLTLVSIAWFTRAAASSAHTLFDQAHSQDWGVPASVPQAIAVFSADPTVRKLVHVPDGTRWTEFDRGEHFPAIELPELLARDLRAFFAELD